MSVKFWKIQKMKIIPCLTDDILKEFWTNVNKTDKCWNWTGYKDQHGYGVLPIKGKLYMAHRISLKVFGEKLKQKRVVDHICRNVLCVNPKHLRQITLVENFFAKGSMALQYLNSLKTHCYKGHEFTKSNTYITPKGWRQCKTCQNKRYKNFMLKTGGVK